MNVRCVKIVMLFLSFWIWIGGCADQEKEQIMVERTALQRPSTPPSSGVGQPKAPIPTMTRIWELRKQKKHKDVIEEVERFVASGLTSADDLGTCLYLKADSLRQLGDFAQAEEIFWDVVTKYPKAKWYDPSAGGYIKVKPLSGLGRRLAAEREKYAFPQNSEDYTALAWKYIDKRGFDVVHAIVQACVAQFTDKAIEQQAAHDRKYQGTLPRLSPEPEENQEILKQFWALYDVGTCYFILGQAYQKAADRLGSDPNSVAKARKLYEQAVQCYEEIIKKYPSAQCFDPKGPWYWSVKKGAEDHRAIIKLTK